MEGTPTREPLAARPMGGDFDDTRSGLHFKVATTLDDVLKAWSLVYMAYRRIDLIDANIHEIHTSRYAASPHAAVFTGEIADQVKATMTTIHDSELGLPLDTVYRSELDALRARGRCLSETGLFADRRDGIGRSVGALLNLMRYAFFFALREQSPSIVIGVHPHHAGFYGRLFGFEQIGEERSYGAVHGKAVVLLHLPLRERLSGHSARGIVSFKEHPIADRDFAGRYPFPPDVLNAPPLAAFREPKPDTH